MAREAEIEADRMDVLFKNMLFCTQPEVYFDVYPEDQEVATGDVLAPAEGVEEYIPEDERDVERMLNEVRRFFGGA